MRGSKLIQSNWPTLFATLSSCFPQLSHYRLLAEQFDLKLVSYLNLNCNEVIIDSFRCNKITQTMKHSVMLPAIIPLIRARVWTLTSSIMPTRKIMVTASYQPTIQTSVQATSNSVKLSVRPQVKIYLISKTSRVFSVLWELNQSTEASGKLRTCHSSVKLATILLCMITRGLIWKAAKYSLTFFTRLKFRIDYCPIHLSTMRFHMERSTSTQRKLMKTSSKMSMQSM